MEPKKPTLDELYDIVQSGELTVNQVAQRYGLGVTRLRDQFLRIQSQRQYPKGRPVEKPPKQRLGPDGR